MILSQELSLEKKRIENAGRLSWLHWIVIIFSIILTISAWYVSKKSIDEKASLQFDKQAEQVVELIYERLQKYEDALWGGVAAIKMNGNKVSYQDWKTFADSLHIDTKYPGINGIGVINYVLPENLENYISEQRKDRPDFEVHPKNQKDEFFPITYIEPLEVNLKAVGLDISYESNRYKAAIKAMNTGDAQITAPIVLVQDEEKTPGFLLYAPFYEDSSENTQYKEKKFIGMVYAPFVMTKLMEGTLQRGKRLVGVKISDGNDVLYNEYADNFEDYDEKPMFQKNLELDLYGRTWVFDIRSSKSFKESIHNSQPIIILIVGIIIDSLLITLFILLANSNQRAIRFINKITE